MKSYIVLTALFLFMIVVNGCKMETTTGKLVIYNPDEIKVLFDNALKVDTIGEPIIQTSTSIDDSTTTTTRSQYYMIYVGHDASNHLIPKDRIQPSQIQAMIAGGSGIGVLTACSFSCKPSKPGDECTDLSGCRPSDCGCEGTPSCGGNCTLSQQCTGTFSGFSFGNKIML